MRPATFRAAGKALYGSRWQTDLAAALDVADRTVRRWDSGEHPIPIEVRSQLRQLLWDRRHAIDELIGKIN